MAALRHRVGIILGTVMVFSTMILVGGTAMAQGYPPGTGTIPPTTEPIEPVTTSARGLAFTGANIFKALLVALVLIALGVLLVTVQRRRRRVIV